MIISLLVIGVGFGRTGTLSLKRALELLGFGPCHHMESVFNDPSQVDLWQAAVEGRLNDWDLIFGDYRSTVDWPSVFFWRELADYYPQAKLVLGIRPANEWWNSFSRTIRRLLSVRESLPEEFRRRILNMAHQMIAVQTFGNNINDQESVVARYQAHIEEVRHSIPASRLLEYPVGSGWQPLCEFLNCSVPAVDYPAANSYAEFWQFFGGSDQLGRED